MEKLFEDGVNVIEFSLKEQGYSLPRNLIVNELQYYINKGFVLSKAIELTRSQLLFEELEKEQQLEENEASESEENELAEENIEGLKEALQSLKEKAKNYYNKLKGNKKIQEHIENAKQYAKFQLQQKQQ